MNETKKFGVAQSIFLLFIIVFLGIIVSLILNGINLKKELKAFFSYLIIFGTASFISVQTYKKYNGKFTIDLNFKHWQLIFLVALLPILMVFGLTANIVNLIPMPEFMKEIFQEMATEDSIFTYLTVIICAPVFEEFICRGVILKGLLEKYTVKKAIIVSSLIFGIMHLNPWQFIGAFGIGIINGWIFWQTKSLFLPIIVHLSNNLFFSLFGIYFGTDYLIDKPMREVFGTTNNQIIGILGAIILFIGLIIYIKNYFYENLKLNENDSM